MHDIKKIWVKATLKQKEKAPPDARITVSLEDGWQVPGHVGDPDENRLLARALSKMRDGDPVSLRDVRTLGEMCRKLVDLARAQSVEEHAKAFCIDVVAGLHQPGGILRWTHQEHLQRGAGSCQAECRLSVFINLPGDLYPHRPKVIRFVFTEGADLEALRERVTADALAAATEYLADFLVTIEKSHELSLLLARELVTLKTRAGGE